MRPSAGVGLSIGAVLGLGLGASVQCGGAAQVVQTLESGACTDDSDCVIHCDGGACCPHDCPCGEAITKAEHQRRREAWRDRCGDAKVACPVTDRNACDWTARHSAVCRAGLCVAEEVEGGAPPEHRPPATPATIAIDDPDARRCLLVNEPGKCTFIVEWDCGEPSGCRMGVPCDPASCETTKTTAVGLDASPWAAALTGSTPPVATGVLLFAAVSDVPRRLFVTDTPTPRPMATHIAVDSSFGFATWVDGSRGALVYRDKSIVHVGFGGVAAKPVLDDVQAVFGLDVSPNGKTLAIATRRSDGSKLQLFDLATWTAKPVPGADKEDGAPRWSPDGHLLAYSRLRSTGLVAIADLENGRVDGRHNDVGLELPTWHPSGEFLLMWHEERQGSERGCRLVLATKDRTRYAPTQIWEAGGYCRPFAVSPDGRHVALWRRKERVDRLQIESIAGDSPPVVVGDFRTGGSVDWATGLTVADLGVTAP